MHGNENKTWTIPILVCHPHVTKFIERSRSDNLAILFNEECVCFEDNCEIT